MRSRILGVDSTVELKVMFNRPIGPIFKSSSFLIEFVEVSGICMDMMYGYVWIFVVFSQQDEA